MPKDSPAARRLRRLKRRLTVANRANRQLVKMMWQSQQLKTLDTIDVPAPVKANYYEETPDEPEVVDANPQPPAATSEATPEDWSEFWGNQDVGKAVID